MKHTLVICYLLFAVFLSACVPSDDTWDRVQGTGILRVGMDASFPPFEFFSTDGVLAGFDIDLAQELGRRLGVEVQFVANLPTDGLYDALELGADRGQLGVDVVISALVVNPAKTADVAYVPYFDAGQVLVVRSGEAGVKTMTDLGEHTLAVEFGTRGDREARKWARRLTGLQLKSYETSSQALAAVVAGDADAALVDHISVLQFGVGGELIVTGKPVVSEPYAIAVSKDGPRLLRAVEEAVAEMKADGTMNTLVSEWLEGDR